MSQRTGEFHNVITRVEQEPEAGAPHKYILLPENRLGLRYTAVFLKRDEAHNQVLWML